MKETQLTIYGARDTKTGKLVSDITNPRKKFWQRESAAREAIHYATSGRYPKYNSLELVTFELVEVKNKHGGNVVDVVRCKDCFYSYLNSPSQKYTCNRHYPPRAVEENDFCSYAKMKGSE